MKLFPPLLADIRPGGTDSAAGRGGNPTPQNIMNKMPIPIIIPPHRERAHPLVILAIYAASGFTTFAIAAAIYYLRK